MTSDARRTETEVAQLRVLGNACAHERRMHQGMNVTPACRAETILWALQQDGWDLSRRGDAAELRNRIAAQIEEAYAVEGDPDRDDGTYAAEIARGDHGDWEPGTLARAGGKQ